MAVVDNAQIPSMQVYNFIYDFAVHGGAQTTLALTALNGPIPNAFIVTSAILDVITGFTGAACTGALALQSANDMVSATIVAGAPFSTTGQKVTIILPGTLSTAIKTTAARFPVITFAVANCTAGRLRLIMEGYQSE